MNDGMSSVARNTAREVVHVMPEPFPGAVVAGFDVHLRQITFDCLDAASGEVTRGRIGSTPAAVEEWVAGFGGREVHVAIEACSGWLFVARALERAGAVAHLAETVETPRSGVASGVRRPTVRTRCGSGSSGRGQTPGGVDRAGAHPPVALRLHLRKALIDERTQWLLRIRSTLYHHGVSAGAPAKIASATGREFLAALDLPADALERIEVALFMVCTLDARIHELELGLRRIARHQAGCQALMTQYGVGELIALVTLTELGDVTRMSSSRKASGSPGSTSAFTALTAPPGSGSSPAKAHPPSAGRYMKPRNQRPGRPAPTTRTTTRSKPAG